MTGICYLFPVTSGSRSLPKLTIMFPLDIATWWQEMPGFEKIFWVFALLFSFLFVIQTVFSFVPGDGDDSMGTSSMIYTLYLPACGANPTCSTRLRISSTELLLAASSS